ncbi:Disintegrin and metalloproteinase domain-containing protein 23, partial [Plecturocebus cupreus]
MISTHCNLHLLGSNDSHASASEIAFNICKLLLLVPLEHHIVTLSEIIGAHVVLDDDTDVGYVEDGTPCGPSMMCLDRKCLQIQALNMSSCPLDSKGKVCSGHGVCSNEATCICDFTWAGTDCSIRDPVRNLHPPKDEGPKDRVLLCHPETGLGYFAQAGLELLASGDIFILASQSAGIIVVSHCTQPLLRHL